MAEKDIQANTYKFQHRPDILRANDIIPSRQPAGEDDTQVDIPQFSLADDIMAHQRRLSALRRKGPSTEDGEQRTEDRARKTEDKWPSSVIRSPSSDFSPLSFAQSYTSLWDPLIADIVARDIERLCRGGSWS